MTTPSRALRSTIAALLTMATTVSAGAAEARVAPGQKLRLSVLDRPYMEGIVLAVEEQQLKLQEHDGTVRAVPFSEISRIEVSRRRSRWKGAGVGAALSAGIFGFAGLMGLTLDKMSPRSPDGKTCVGTNWEGTYEYQCLTAGNLGSYVAGGVVIGAILGAAVTPGERYVPIEPRRFAVRVAPLPDGVAARVSLGF